MGCVEPEWTLISPRAQAAGRTRNLNWADRTRIAPARLGVTGDTHLTWRRGSVLSRLTDGKADASKELTRAAREMRDAFDQQKLKELEEPLKLVTAAARQMGVPGDNLPRHRGIEALCYFSVPLSRTGHQRPGAPGMRVVLYACLVILLGLPAAADMPKVAPEGSVWDTSPEFAFPGADKPKKLRRALSGITCPIEFKGPRRCIAVFDEGGEARYAMIDDTSMMPQPERIVLLAGNGELDAEGAARDGGFAYVTGSHSRKRDPCVANPDSRHVYRLALQPDGRMQPSSPPVDDQGRLWRLMSANPVLGPFVDKCLGRDGHGINIEGLAARNDQLYFGFREPAQDRTAYILRVAARALFEGGDLAPRLFTLEAGKASGIRDLLAVPEGLLVLVGPDDDSKKDIPWWIGFWDGSDASADITLRQLGELKLPEASGGDCQKEIKPEAMTLLADGPDFRRLLILSDGMCDGGPLVFRIRK